MVDKLGFTSILQNFEKTGWKFFLILIPTFLSRVFAAATLHYLVRGFVTETKLSIWKLTSVTFTAFALRDAIPVVRVAGELYKGFALSKELGGATASRVVLLYNFCYTFGHLTLFFIGALVGIFLLGFPVQNAILICSSLVILSLFLLILIFRAPGVIFSIPLIFLRGPIRERYVEFQRKALIFWQELLSQIKARPKRLRNAFVIYLSGRLIECLEVFAVIQIIGVGISIPEAIFIDSMTVLATTLFFFFPYGAGIRESGASLSR